jgi:hypothetical protein
VTNVVFRNVHVEFAGGGDAEQARHPVRDPGVDARPLPAWGFYARNVANVALEDVRFSLGRDDLRPVVLADRVQRLTLDHVRCPRVAGVQEPLVLTNVASVQVRHSDLGPDSAR